MSLPCLSRRDALCCSLAALCPGMARAFLFPSEAKPLFAGTRRPLIDLQASGGDLRRPARPADGRQDAGALTLSLRNANTGERLALRFADRGGRLAPDRPAALDHFLRDWRQDIVKPIDPEIAAGLATLVAEAARQGWRGEVQIASGYRTRKTNDLLRRQGAGAASNSFHIRAMAIDLALPGIPPEQLGALARATLPGGVGTYPGFVHIDSGPARSWTG